jgi:hypothetical protein
MKVLSFIFIFLAGCVVIKNKDPKQTLAQQLNGDNYSTAAVLPGAILLNAKPITKKISGKVFCGAGAMQVPANHAMVSLLKGAVKVNSVSTKTNGEYSLSAQFSAKEQYFIEVKANCGDAIQELPKFASETILSMDFNLEK